MSTKKRSKSRAGKRSPAPFYYENLRKKIAGRDDNKHLLFLCYLDSLRWLIWPLIVVLIVWLRQLLSG